ncbi:PH domain-containing protein [Nocardioides aurantiacus]|uniref:PH (Pleckstrin Homology) domain-containing protein n=1 Tax=Nocardioides aurantiacus TaxID=86796 RepID=A0A3N2CT65_9ACTN|nr:PH domain-containing protein [Nocardioides aurantiacus]ROR90578.1 PH (Pleckstrin Homology) domain-containing protein [Nocardioides aurantiacus]
MQALGPTEVVRAPSARALGATMVALAVLGTGSTLLGGPTAVRTYAAPLVLFGLLGWAAFWRACVEVSDGGVRVVNTLRTVEVPWPALEEVEGRYGLRLRTAYGTVQAWAAQAPSGTQRARGEPGPAAVRVQARLEALRAAGHLDDGRLERPDLRRTWHSGTLAGVAVLAVATVVLPLLG